MILGVLSMVRYIVTQRMIDLDLVNIVTQNICTSKVFMVDWVILPENQHMLLTLKSKLVVVQNLLFVLILEAYMRLNIVIFGVKIQTLSKDLSVEVQPQQ